VSCANDQAARVIIESAYAWPLTVLYCYARERTLYSQKGGPPRFKHSDRRSGAGAWRSVTVRCGAVHAGL